MLVLAVVVSSFISLGEYAIVPGNAQNVGPLIGVPRPLAHAHRGAVLLTDVDLVQVRAVDWLYYRYLDAASQIEPTGALTGQTSISTYDEQGVIDMALAQQAATVASLHELGYPVQAVPTGAIVYQLEQPSAVAGILSVGEVIVSVAGHRVTTLESLAQAIGDERPGAKVSVVTHRIGSSKTATVKVVLGEAHVSGSGEAATVTCLPAGQASTATVEERNGKPVGRLGIYLNQLYTPVHLPFSVNINSEGIIGPSAGLAFALGVMEKVDTKDLTGGHRVAATGTMSVDGTVGDVGGVAQKTVAVERAGASVFFVPSIEYAVAKQHASGGLKVYPVNSLAAAVTILRHLGGAIARPPSS